MAMHMATTSPLRRRSRKISIEASAIQIGLVVTSTVLLATEVYASELIQVAKCAASRQPASNARRRSRRDKPRISLPTRASASGVSSSAASVRRSAAIDSDGTPAPCA